MENLSIARMRKGWEDEHLAKYILSKFCFVSEPSTPGDDVGSDIICTFFKREKQIKSNTKGEEEVYLYPEISFAIQIKNKNDYIYNKGITIKKNNSSYLNHIEIPYLVGLIDQNKSTLDIHLGESIPHFFSYFGDNITQNFGIVIKPKIPSKNKNAQKNNQFFKQCLKNIHLNFPFFDSFEAKYNYELDNDEKVSKLKIACKAIQENISSKKNNEFFFFAINYENKKGVMDNDLDNGRKLWIYTGSGSAQTYENNLFKRLTEALLNVAWKCRNKDVLYLYKIPEFDIKEFYTLKNVYKNIINFYKSPPEYLTTSFKNVNDYFIAIYGENLEIDP